MTPTKQHGGHTGAIRGLLVGAAVVPLAFGFFRDTPVPGLPHTLVAALWVLSLLPAYSYLSTPSTRRRSLPFLPTVSLMYGLYYALPLTLGITDQYFNAPVDPVVDYEYPVELALFGWIAMMVAYGALGLVIREKARIRETEWRPRYLARWGLVFLYGPMLVTVIRFYLGATQTTGGIFQFTMSLYWFGAGLLTILARRGALDRVTKLLLIIGVIAGAILVLAGGSIAPMMMLCAAVGFGLWIGKPSIQAPWVIAAIVILLFAMSLRGVVIEFRKQAWFGDVKLTQSQQIGLMLRLLGTRAENDGVFATVANGVATTGGRSANLDLFANVVRRTPSEVPYWKGETYKSLIGSFVPRFLWPDKPSKELGQAFGHR